VYASQYSVDMCWTIQLPTYSKLQFRLKSTFELNLKHVCKQLSTACRFTVENCLYMVGYKKHLGYIMRYVNKSKLRVELLQPKNNKVLREDKCAQPSTVSRRFPRNDYKPPRSFSLGILGVVGSGFNKESETPPAKTLLMTPNEINVDT